MSVFSIVLSCVNVFLFTMQTSCFVTGIPVRSSLDNSTTVQYASLLNMITTKACSAVRDLDPTDELILLRIRSKKNEIICAPGK